MKNAEKKLEIAEDIRVRLAGSDAAREKFEKLPYSHQKEWIDYIEQAKRPETRARRIARMLTGLD